MNKQPNLPFGDDDGEAHARRNDPDTSHEAAESMKGSKAQQCELIVLEGLRSIGGEGTAYQIEMAVRPKHPTIDSNTITPRFAPMERKGLLRRTDRRGPGRGARKQIIWEIL